MNENGASDEPHSDESIYSLQSPRQKKKHITEILVTANKTEDNILIKFQVDTGASCSTITLKDYKKITHEMPEKSNVKLKLYDQSLIPPIGSTKLYCTANGVRKKVHFKIVEYASTSLLSGRASEALKLIHFNEECILHVDRTSDESLTQEKILHNYRDIFTGLGKLPGTYYKDMPYPFKKIQDVCLFQLKMSLKARSKSSRPWLDVKDGFLQVVLGEPSSYLTTFWTPFGRYRWLRMPFEIKSAPEEFKRRLDERLEGLENIAVIHDDIVIFASSETTEEATVSHDVAFKVLLDRCRERGLNLNKNKLRFQLSKVAYMGHILGSEGLQADPDKKKPYKICPVQQTYMEFNG